MEDLVKVFKQQYPEEFELNYSDRQLTLRDNTVDRGRGYKVTITKETRYYLARIEFEDYAKQLIDYAEKQLNQKNSALIQIFKKYPEFSGKIYRQTVENIFDPESARPDHWEIRFEFRTGTDIFTDARRFSDVLLCYVLFLFPYDIEGDEEGETVEIMSKRYERSRLNRAICLAFHGYNCKACGTNLRNVYSGLSSEFIHVHHLNPVHASGICMPDPVKDMVPLCPNCHSVAHMKNPPYTVEEISRMINMKND